MIRTILFVFFALAIIQLVNSQTIDCISALNDLTNDATCEQAGQSRNAAVACSGTCKNLYDNAVNVCSRDVRF